MCFQNITSLSSWNRQLCQNPIPKCLMLCFSFCVKKKLERTGVGVGDPANALEIKRVTDNGYGDWNDESNESREKAELLPSRLIGVEELIRWVISGVWWILRVCIFFDFNVTSGAAKFFLTVFVHHCRNATRQACHFSLLFSPRARNLLEKKKKNQMVNFNGSSIFN